MSSVSERLDVPFELESGVYANAISVWHTPYEVIADFAVRLAPEPSDPDDPESDPVTPARVVSRVRIPPTFVFEVVRAINGELTVYEAEFGEVSQPRRRDEEEET